MKLKITVHGVAYEVDVEVLEASDEMQSVPSPLPSVPRTKAGPSAPAPPPPAAAQRSGASPAAASDGAVSSPIAGTVLEVKVESGEEVKQGQDLLVIEAMKMETVIAAPREGVVKKVLVAAGDSVREGQSLLEFE